MSPGPVMSTSARNIHCGKPSPRRWRLLARTRMMPITAKAAVVQVTSLKPKRKMLASVD